MRDPFPGQNDTVAAIAAEWPSWAVELGGRVRGGFPRTVIATSLLTGAFFVAYFGLQQHPAYTPFMMPLTGLDLLIPFQPLALVAYLSLWLSVGVGPGLQRTAQEFAVCGLWLCGLCVSGLVIFYFWPTQIPPPALMTGFPGFSMLHRLGGTSNACPSMPVA